MRAKREKPVEVQCLHCGLLFLKKVSEIQKSPNHFCSRSCATSFHNRISAKREISGKCQQCDVSIHRKYVYCDQCRAGRWIQNRTLRDVICRTVYTVGVVGQWIMHRSIERTLSLTSFFIAMYDITATQ